jgi:aspartyl-tRNA(Asn)/glutamyl-tRNA(Gln) amidotransferase subunit A
MRGEDIRRVIDEPGLRREVGATELVEALLGRIEERQPQLNAFITITHERAREDAGRVDRARHKGQPLLLDGLPIAVKDNIDVAGVRRTSGSKIFESYVSAADAEVVRRLRNAGAVVLGKTLLHEFAYGVTCRNPFYGSCGNSWDPSRISGGSSGGSAVAVAADLCIGALGTDTGGSVRVPAALNGVSGLRPTVGCVSNRGIFPVSWSFDAVGPMARSMKDIADMFFVMAGFDPRDPRSIRKPRTDGRPRNVPSLHGKRIGIPNDYFFDHLPVDIARCFEEAKQTFADLGATAQEVSIPGIRQTDEIWRPLIAAEARAVHLQHLRKHPDLYGDDVRVRLDRGAEVTGTDFAVAMQRAYAWRRAVEDVFKAVDLLLTPTVATVADDRNSEPLATNVRYIRLAFPWSLAHLSAASVPCGLSDEGLPVGIQIAAAPWRDGIVLEAAAAYQGLTDWHKQRPRVGALEKGGVSGPSEAARTSRLATTA